jgi:hypothetical protein
MPSMPIMISIPDDRKTLAEAVERLAACSQQAIRRAIGGRAVDYAQIEPEVGERTAEVERAAHLGILTALDVDVPTVVIGGRLHTRVHRVEGRYYTLAGDVVVTRSLYRAERQGKVALMRPDGGHRRKSTAPIQPAGHRPRERDRIHSPPRRDRGQPLRFGEHTSRVQSHPCHARRAITSGVRSLRPRIRTSY